MKQGAVGLGGSGLQRLWFSPCGLVSQLGPEECDELAGDRDVGDGRAFAGLGEVTVAVIEPDLGLPGSRGWFGPASRAPGGVAVVPGRFDQQPAGVPVSGLGDMPAVLLVTGGVLTWGDPQPGRKLARVGEAREVTDLSDQPGPAS